MTCQSRLTGIRQRGEDKMTVRRDQNGVLGNDDFVGNFSLRDQGTGQNTCLDVEDCRRCSMIEVLLDLLCTLLLIAWSVAGAAYRLVLPRPDKNIAGQTVLVTGAARGIGYAIANQFGLKGAKLVLIDINQSELKTAVDDFKNMGVSAQGYACDVTDYQAVHQMAERVRQECGPVDILVNNAGVLTAKPLLEASEAEIKKTLDVNLLSNFWTVKAFLPSMMERKLGHVVVIASMAGKSAVRYLTDYCASKYGALGFAYSLREELKESHPEINVTTVCPLFVNTPMIKMQHAKCKSRFIPLLETIDVARACVQAVLRNTEEVLLPAYCQIITILIPILPSKAMDAIFRFLASEFVLTPKGSDTLSKS